MGEVGRIKENGGGGEFNYNKYCKNFGKCHSVPPVQQYNKKFKN
jgi:hypothetical protein